MNSDIFIQLIDISSTLLGSLGVGWIFGLAAENYIKKEEKKNDNKKIKNVDKKEEFEGVFTERGMCKLLFNLIFGMLIGILFVIFLYLFKYGISNQQVFLGCVIISTIIYSLYLLKSSISESKPKVYYLTILQLIPFWIGMFIGVLVCSFSIVYIL